MTVKPETVQKFKIRNKPQVDYDKEYSVGFKEACEKRKVDPLKLLEIAKTLELHL